MERKLIRKQLKTDKDNQKLDKVLNAFEDEKDKLLGVLIQKILLHLVQKKCITSLEIGQV